MRYRGELPNPVVPAYTVLDVSVGGNVSRALQLSLRVANARDKEHREFAAASTGAVFGAARTSR